ncbi:MAG: hypothetical protein WCV83_01025 [Candidatus Magasanikbacteria bacterium]
MKTTTERKDLQPTVGEREEGAQHLESKETVARIGSTFGKELGWFNITSDTAKVVDAQLLNVSGYDVEFVKQFHRVRDLVEAVTRWSGQRFKGLANAVDVYKVLDTKMPMSVKLLDEEKKETEQSIDLTQLASLVKILEYNNYLGTYGIPEDELINKFLADEDLVVTVPKMEKTGDGKWISGPDEEKEVVDLRAMCPVDDMKDFSFDAYIAKIKKYQIGFQWLGGLRDQAVSKMHTENGSHTLFVESGRITAYGFKEYLWMPTCTSMTIADARTDVPKSSISTRAKGHVHEVGQFDELTGTSVGFDPALLKIHRGEIGVRDHNQTNARMNHAAVGLGQKEDIEVQEKEVTINGKPRKMSVAVIGNSRRGSIYKGMHDTYDEGMERIRGFGLTDQEADDLIFTRVIAPFIYNNSMDWLMCFAKAAGSNFGYSPEKAVVKGGQNWSEYGKDGFCVAIPCKDGDSKTGLKYFFDYNELIEYVNQRIADNEVRGILKTQKIQEFAGLTEKQVKEATEDSGYEDAEDELELTSEKERLIFEIFRDIFGSDLSKVLEEYKRNGLGANVVFGGSTKKLRDILIEQFKSKTFDQILRITDESGQGGAKILMTELSKRYELLGTDMLELSRGATLADKPKSQFDIAKHKEIGNINVQLANFTLAFNLCKDLLGAQPGFVEQTNVDGADTVAKKMQKLDTTDWGSALLRVAKIIKFIGSDAGLKTRFSAQSKDPKWLAKEALIQLKKFKLIKDLGL